MTPLAQAPPSDLLTIGQVAQRTGVSTSALRFYEREGLVVPVARTSTGYRLYDDERVARVRFLRQAQQLGLSLTEVAELLSAVDFDDPLPTRERLRHLVAHKLVSTRAQIEELQEFARQLERVHLRLTGAPGCGCRHLNLCGCVPMPLTLVDESRRELTEVRAGCSCGCDTMVVMRAKPDVTCG